MIAFAIIRAKQVLVGQFFVNLTLLMVWSTLAASVCKFFFSLTVIDACQIPPRAAVWLLGRDVGSANA